WWREIDIEIVGTRLDTIETVIHCIRYDDASLADGVPFDQSYWVIHADRWGHHKFDFRLDETYHTYAIESTPTYISWSLDGVEYRRVEEDWIEPMQTSPNSIAFQVWGGCDPNWCGPLDQGVLPIYQYVKWFKYSEYTPGQGPDNSDFTVSKTDEFDGTELNADDWRFFPWQQAGTQFTENCIVVKEGTLIMCLTADAAGGHQGTVPPDDGPAVAGEQRSGSTIVERGVGARLKGNTIVGRVAQPYPATAVLLDAQGRRVRTAIPTSARDGTGEFSIDCASLAPGAYVLTIAGGATQQSQRIVRQR
ncbi:MAG: family 16 glycosylhydrolase, partial [Chitinivibrionales bacterium]|nr:family 16 glycosylhydrolase [Chitinivibrionales bacterium]MBD3395959.1 family 16 glycosylhydrolase [Chitinivibrionales bacterium]